MHKQATKGLRIKTTRIRNERPQTIEKANSFRIHVLCDEVICFGQPNQLGLHSFFLANANKVKNHFKENPKRRKQRKKPQKNKTGDVANGQENEAQSP